jgi:hypothetical protein
MRTSSVRSFSLDVLERLNVRMRMSKTGGGIYIRGVEPDYGGVLTTTLECVYTNRLIGKIFYMASFLLLKLVVKVKLTKVNVTKAKVTILVTKVSC